MAILPRGSAKSTLAARLAVHHVLSRAEPGFYVCAASRDQARVIGAMVRKLSLHPVVAEHVIWRTDALRRAHDPKGPAILSVVASDGGKGYGWPYPTLLLADEIFAWESREPTLLGALMTAMLKNAECRFVGISTAAASLDSPLGRLRARAMAASHVQRKGVVLEAGGTACAGSNGACPRTATRKTCARSPPPTRCIGMRRCSFARVSKPGRVLSPRLRHSRPLGTPRFFSAAA